MKLVDRNDIERWAERFDSKGNFATLISKLVRATTPPSTEIDFPSESAAFIGGWDGVIDCQEEKGVVPMGISLWEFGTEDYPKGKADKDYKKRTADPLGYVSKSTFIFVTPRFWKFKDRWRLAKLKEGKWKYIRVYDSPSIEQ
jgi:hypothetical protein